MSVRSLPLRLSVSPSTCLEAPGGSTSAILGVSRPGEGGRAQTRKMRYMGEATGEATWAAGPLEGRNFAEFCLGGPPDPSRGVILRNFVLGGLLGVPGPPEGRNCAEFCFGGPLGLRTLSAIKNGLVCLLGRFSH